MNLGLSSCVTNMRRWRPQEGKAVQSALSLSTLHVDIPGHL